MSGKLLPEQRLDFLSQKEVAQARLSLHVSKYHFVGNHMSRLIYYWCTYQLDGSFEQTKLMLLLHISIRRFFIALSGVLL